MLIHECSGTGEAAYGILWTAIAGSNDVFLNDRFSNDYGHGFYLTGSSNGSEVFVAELNNNLTDQAWNVSCDNNC